MSEPVAALCSVEFLISVRANYGRIILATAPHHRGGPPTSAAPA